MERRELFKVLAATTVTQVPAQHVHNEKTATSAYKPRFFTPAEFELIDHLSETILPADEDSGGAREAQVPVYIDTFALYSDAPTTELWRSGLASVDRLAEERFQRRFPSLESRERDQIVADLLANERSPTNEAERMAARLKQAVIEAWGASEPGMKYFRYKGNGATFTFPGCNHNAHK